MTILGPEGLVTSVKEYLEENLGPILTDVDLRFPRTVDLEKILEWRIDDPLQRGTLPNVVPCGWIVVPLLEIDEWAATYQYGGSELLVWLLLADQDSEILRQRLYRTTIAVWECVRNGSLSRDINWSILNTPTIDFSALLTGHDNLFFGDVRLRFRMYTREMV